MAWVEERNGRYWVRWRDGQGRKRQRLFKDKVQACLFAEVLPARGPARHTPASLTLGEYLLDTLATAEDLRESTRYHYLGMVRRHFLPVLGSLPLADVEATELRAFFLHMREQGYSRSYRAIARNVLSRTFGLAAAEGIVGRNPLSAVPPPQNSTRREVRPLEVYQVEALADAILPRYRVPVLVMAYAGLRVGEVGALTMPNANLLRRELRVHVGVARAGGRPSSRPQRLRQGVGQSQCPSSSFGSWPSTSRRSASHQMGASSTRRGPTSTAMSTDSSTLVLYTSLSRPQGDGQAFRTSRRTPCGTPTRPSSSERARTRRLSRHLWATRPSRSPWTSTGICSPVLVRSWRHVSMTYGWRLSSQTKLLECWPNPERWLGAPPAYTLPPAWPEGSAM
jgi:hypothetical protein